MTDYRQSKNYIRLGEALQAVGISVIYCGVEKVKHNQNELQIVMPAAPDIYQDPLIACLACADEAAHLLAELDAENAPLDIRGINAQLCNIIGGDLATLIPAQKPRKHPQTAAGPHDYTRHLLEEMLHDNGVF